MSEARITLRIPSAQASQDAQVIRRELEAIRRAADEAKAAVGAIDKAATTSGATQETDKLAAATRGATQAAEKLEGATRRTTSILVTSATNGARAQRDLARSTHDTEVGYLALLRALDRAEQQLLNVEAAARRAKADPAVLKEAQDAYSNLEKVVSQTSVSHDQLYSAQSRFTAGVGLARREIAVLNRAWFEQIASGQRLAGMLGQINPQLGQMAHQFAALSKIGPVFLGVGAAITVTIFAVTKLVQALNEAAKSQAELNKQVATLDVQGAETRLRQMTEAWEAHLLTVQGRIGETIRQWLRLRSLLGATDTEKDIERQRDVLRQLFPIRASEERARGALEQIETRRRQLDFQAQSVQQPGVSFADEQKELSSIQVERLDLIRREFALRRQLLKLETDSKVAAAERIKNEDGVTHALQQQASQLQRLNQEELLARKQVGAKEAERLQELRRTDPRILAQAEAEKAFAGAFEIPEFSPADTQRAIDSRRNAIERQYLETFGRDWAADVIEQARQESGFKTSFEIPELSPADTQRAIDRRREVLEDSYRQRFGGRDWAADIVDRVKAETPFKDAFEIPELSEADVLAAIDRRRQVIERAYLETFGRDWAADIAERAKAERGFAGEFEQELKPDIAATRFRDIERENQQLQLQLQGRSKLARLIAEENSLRDQGRNLTDAARESLLNLISDNERLEVALARQREFVAGIRSIFSSAFEDVGRTITEAFVKGEASALKFEDIITGVVASVINRLLVLSVIRPLEGALFGTNQNQLGGLVGSLGNVLGSLISGAGSGTGTQPIGIQPGADYYGAHGLALAGGRLLPFGRGAVVTGPRIFPMATGTGLMGEAGPEAILPLKRGPSGDLGVRSTGGSAPVVNVNVQNNAGNVAQAQAQTRRNQAGGVDIDVLIEQKMKQMVNGGKFDTQMRQRYGMRGPLSGT